MTAAKEVQWPREHADALKEMVVGGYGTFAQIAVEITRRFGKPYSRSACLGRARRMGLPSVNPKGRRKYQKISPRPGIAKVIPINDHVERLMYCEELEPLVTTFMDIGVNSCRWPYGEGPYAFCGRGKVEGRSYCLDHLRVSIGTASERATLKAVG